MGEMAEYYYDLAIQEELSLEYFMGEFYDDMFELYQNNLLSWETKQNKTIIVQDLKDSHLLNIIKMLKNVSDNLGREEYKRILNIEKNKRNL